MRVFTGPPAEPEDEGEEWLVRVLTGAPVEPVDGCEEEWLVRVVARALGAPEPLGAPVLLGAPLLEGLVRVATVPLPAWDGLAEEWELVRVTAAAPAAETGACDLLALVRGEAVPWPAWEPPLEPAAPVCG